MYVACLWPQGGRPQELGTGSAVLCRVHRRDGVRNGGHDSPQQPQALTPRRLWLNTDLRDLLAL